MLDTINLMTSGAASLSDAVHEHLRSDILNGVYAPGQPLRLEAMSTRYGVSFTPLREALVQLQAEQLVTSSGKRGFRVSPVSLRELWETIHARVVIESEALRLSFQNGDDDWEASLVSAFHGLDKIRKRIADQDELSPEERVVIEQRHEHFHRMLVAGCRSEVLIRLIESLKAQTERYRRPWLSRSVPETLGRSDADEDHRAMLEAALARDGDRGVAVLRSHLVATGTFIQAHQAAHGDVNLTGETKALLDRLTQR